MQTKERVLILQADSNGGYPVPAVRGGAVSTLVEHLVRENNKRQLVDMTIMSIYNAEAELKAKEAYPNIRFIWVRSPKVIRGLDSLIRNSVKTIFPKKKLLSYMSIASLLFYIWKASRLLRKERFDKVVLQNNIPLAWAIKLSNYQGDFFYHLHNTPRTNAKCMSVFDRCKTFLCVSKSVGYEIASRQNPIGPVHEDKIKVLYNCIDTSHFREKEINRKKWLNRFGIHNEERIILYAGRLSQEKGIDQLLQAIDYIQTINIRVLIVGAMTYNSRVKDNYQQELLSLAEQHKNKVVFTGYISQQELPDVYNLADISVLPSMWEEPAGLTMIESLACGTPVITTQSGGIPEYVGDGAIILKRDADLPKRIAKNIDLLLGNDELYCELQCKGMERVRSHFSSDEYMRRFIDAIA